MDVSSQNSDYLCLRKLCRAYSFKRSCFFLLVFFLLAVVFLGVIVLVVIFYLKPQKPVFSLQNVSLDSYKLNAYSGSTLFLSSVITLSLNATNPSKVGIWYSPSGLETLSLHDGLPIGTIRIPGFLQPAHSSNVSFETRVLFPCVNISQIVAEASLQDDSRKNMFQMKIVGDVGAHLLAFHIILLKIKIALECDLNIDYKELMMRNKVYTIGGIKNHIASFPTNTNANTFFINCSLALYI
ncbi:uncharacterized protein LOC125468346 isoform X2 [Pyrus x bretschneideri]|uniref:uncharacterized protein LOC125468346 isoform X2 n=1 Tax=Pyrus x bretschneideri TaxID=225117 RepID=UPI00202F97F8|nr:uncharacterized protein LOC125468346 isoform X2 [Pyrus x bretschneideri]